MSELNPMEMEKWIVEHYGPINFDQHDTYIIASVPLFNPGTAAVGVGSRRDVAIVRLRQDIRIPE